MRHHLTNMTAAEVVENLEGIVAQLEKERASLTEYRATAARNAQRATERGDTRGAAREWKQYRDYGMDIAKNSADIKLLRDTPERFERTSLYKSEVRHSGMDSSQWERFLDEREK